MKIFRNRIIPHIIHRFYTIFGYEVEIRCESETFRTDLKRMADLVTDRKMAEYRTAYQEACKKYGADDTAIIRLSTFAEFMTDE